MHTYKGDAVALLARHRPCDSTGSRFEFWLDTIV